MPVLKVKNNGVWEEVAGVSGHTHNTSDITDFPTRLPADGGNADTLDGRHADEFVLASDLGQFNVSVDTTLTQEGRAADAKAVGDALLEHKNDTNMHVTAEEKESLLEAANNVHGHSNKEVLDNIASTVDIYANTDEPVDATDGSVWIDMGSENEAPSIFVRRSGTWEMSSDGKAQKQANWDSTDASDASYIRNKPFGYTADLFANSNLEFSVKSFLSNNIYSASIPVDFNIMDTIDTGTELVVIWDSVEYIVAAKETRINEYLSANNALGNTSIVCMAYNSDYGIDSGEPFCIIPGLKTIYTKSTLSTHSVQIKDKNNIVKIDAAFLPDEALLSPVQPDWNETDESSYAFIKNKPESFGTYEHPETHPASMIEGLSSVATSGDYNDLINQPPIPSIEGLATTTYVDEKVASISGSGSGGTIDQVQSDWNESDETSPAYIKNKPDISSSGGSIEIEERGSATETVIFEEQTLTGFADGALEVSPSPFELTEGETYRVVWDGVEHKCVCSMQDGIPVVADGALDDTGMPVSGTFLIAFVVNESLGIDGAIVNAFDFSGGSLAPDSATEHTLAIYQKVTSDKVILEKKTYEDFVFGTGNNMYYKGGGNWFALEEGKTYRVSWGEEEYTCKAYRYEIGGYENIYLGNESLLKGESTELVEPFLIYYVPVNNYAALGAANGDTSASHEVGIWEVVPPEQKILQYEDGKLVAVPVEQSVVAMYIENNMPGSAVGEVSWNNITDKPFYETSTTTDPVELLPLTTYNDFAFRSYLGVYMSQTEMTYSLTIGKTYTVFWDGNEYSCVAQDADSVLSGAIALGNCSNFGLSGNNEPFIIVNNVDGYNMYIPLTDTQDGIEHSIQIIQDSEEIMIVHKLDPKFIPIPYFGEGETKQTEVIPAADITFSYESDMGIYVYADNAPSTEQLAMWQSDWTSLDVIWDGTVYNCEPQYLEGMKCIGNIDFLIGTGDNGMPFILMMADVATFGEDICMVYSLSDYPEDVDNAPDITHNVGALMNQIEITTIDPKFIESVSWNKITDKPFGEVPAGTIVLEESVTMGSVGSDDQRGMTILNNLKGQYVMDGVNYIVAIDGVEYTGVGALEDGAYCIYIQDSSLNVVGYIVPNYFGHNIFGNVVAYLPNGNTYDVKITLAEDIVSKIDKKYLPDDIGGSSLPEVTTSDDNKVMTVVNGEWVAKTITHPTELPAVWSSDNDKVLTVVNGAWKAVTPASGLPDVTSTDNGKILAVSNGTWTAQTITHPTELPAVTMSDAGKFLRVGSDGSWIVETIQNVSEVGL